MTIRQGSCTEQLIGVVSSETIGDNKECSATERCTRYSYLKDDRSEDSTNAATDKVAATPASSDSSSCDNGVCGESNSQHNRSAGLSAAAGCGDVVTEQYGEVQKAALPSDSQISTAPKALGVSAPAASTLSRTAFQDHCSKQGAISNAAVNQDTACKTSQGDSKGRSVFQSFLSLLSWNRTDSVAAAEFGQSHTPVPTITESCNERSLDVLFDTVRCHTEPSPAPFTRLSAPLQVTQASAQTLNNWEDGYPSFPEFAVSEEEVTEYEDRLHSTDEACNAMNGGKLTDPEHDVILLVETLPRGVAKFIFSWMAHLLLVSFVALISMFALKLARPMFGLAGVGWYVFNIALAAPCLVVAVWVMVGFARRLYIVRQQKMKWSATRWRLCHENAIQVFAMVFANVFWVVPAAYVLGTNCTNYSDTVVSWFAVMRHAGHYVNLVAFIARAYDINQQAQGTQKEGRHRGRRGWLTGVLVFLLWAIPVGALFAEAILTGVRNDNSWIYHTNPDNCNDGDWNCLLPDGLEWTLYVYGATLPVYFIVYLALVGRAYKITQSKSYTSHRMANMLLALTMRQNLVTFLLSMLSQILLVWIQPDACATATITWVVGPLPADLVMNGTIVLPAILFMPALPCANTTKQYVERSKTGIFTWLEKDKTRSLAQVTPVPSCVPHTSNPRTEQSIPGSDPGFTATAPRPSLQLAHPSPHSLIYNAHTYVFCFETALKCLYWNWCAYLHNNEDGLTDWGGFDIATAMQMYGMRSYEVIVEPTTAVKCLIGWDDRRIIMAFRGTVSIRNCYQNIKVGKTIHPPRRVVRCARSFDHVPRVHTGFACSWYRQKFNKAVLEQLAKVCSSVGRPGGKGMQLLVTGHSLGAAMAMVAALDVAPSHQVGSSFSASSNRSDENAPRFAFEWIQVYTFGCPHVGNASFARDYNTRVPDTWNIINDQDAVARSAKFSSVFIRLFERPGHKVLVNKKGEMLVAPSVLETHLNLMPGLASWDDHVMSSYDEVLFNVCKAQFTQKGRQGGLVGMLSILQNNTLRRYYHSRGLDVYAEIERIREELTGEQEEREGNKTMRFFHRLSGGV